MSTNPSCNGQVLSQSNQISAPTGRFTFYHDVQRIVYRMYVFYLSVVKSALFIAGLEHRLFRLAGS